MFAPDSTSSYSKLRVPRGPGLKDRILPCIVNYCQGNRLQIIASETIPVGTAVGVEHEDTLLLGEIVINKPQAHLWQVEIRIDQALNGLMKVMALQARLLEEERTETPATA